MTTQPITHDPAAVDNAAMAEYHIHAEHCPGPFFMGWHLYMDEVIDGIPTANNNHRWLKHAYDAPEMLVAIASAYGVTIPTPERYTDTCAKTVGMQRPQGFRVLLQKDRPYLKNFVVTPELLRREMERPSRWRYAVDDMWQCMPLVEMTAFDSEALLIWLHELDEAAMALHKAAQKHDAGDHCACEHAAARLQADFADIGLSEAEAGAIIASFGDWLHTPMATLERIAPMWARYHGANGEG